MDFFKGRMLIIQALFGLVFSVFLIKLFHLQIIAKSYKDLASQNVVRRIQLHPDRGLIYDRNGKLIVTNDAVYDLYAVPRQVDKNMDTAKFCELLNMDIETFRTQMKKVREQIRQKKRPQPFLKQITVEEFARFQEYMYQFPGFYSELRTIRRYPYKSATHILGYVGEVDQSTVEKSGYYKSGDYIGISGIEKVYEEELRGTRGCKHILVDVHNREKGSFRNGALDTFAVSGHDLRLSIDIDLQMYGELLMRNKKGSIIAIDPKTGEVLAMVSSPSYDPNLLSGRKRSENFKVLSDDTLKPLYNRAIQGFYPPGSTFKTVMALIGLQEKTLSAASAYSCRPGYYVGSFSVGCRPHPVVTNLTMGLQYSCNAYFCSVFRNILDQPKFKNTQESLGVWHQYVTSFGLGNKLGIDIPNESGGLVPNPEYYNRIYKNQSWKSLTVVSLGIGQGELGITPLQMANIAVVIANRGYFYTPHFVTHIASDSTHRLDDFKIQHMTMVDKLRYEPVIEAMFQTVEQGTARGAKIPGIAVCGKTGTAQNPNGEDNSLFIAFAPKDNPKIAISVVVENAGHGSTYAAPIATLVIEKFLNDTISGQRLALEKKMIETDLIHPTTDETQEPVVRH
ncbi:MAG TPA: penicillin-binding protein 2 [Chitinophagales bacterium]|nr:penicillin-binding protein 2 [Chitinophagales bacterium]